MREKPNKGFFKELAKKQTPDNKKDPFTWKEPVVRLPNSSDSLASTPRRIAKHVAVQPSKTNIVSEHNQHVKKRRGIV